MTISEDEILRLLRPGCICKGIKLYKLIEAIEQGASSFDEIAALTGIGGGSCNAKRCGQKVRELLAEKEKKIPK